MQEIIVYRNPGEKMFWDSVMNGTFFPAFLWFAGGMLVSYLAIYYGLVAINRRWSEGATLIAGISSFIIGCFCAYKFA